MGRTAVSLAQARAKARELHQAVREGRNPLEEHNAEDAKTADAAKAQAGAMTFAQVASMYIDAREASWRSDRHRQQWHNTLRDYVLPVIGDVPVGSVDRGAVMTLDDAAEVAGNVILSQASVDDPISEQRGAVAAQQQVSRHKQLKSPAW